MIGMSRLNIGGDGDFCQVQRGAIQGDGARLYQIVIHIHIIQILQVTGAGQTRVVSIPVKADQRERGLCPSYNY